MTRRASDCHAARDSFCPDLIVWDTLLWLEQATLDFLEIDKVWRVDAGLSPDLDQLRGLEEAAGIVQRGPL